MRHANALFFGQIHQQATGNADFGGQSCAFRTNRIFDDLHQNRLPVEQLRLNRWQLIHRRLARGRAVRGNRHVCHVQKCGTLQADFDERGLHTGQDANDFTQINITDQAKIAVSLDENFLNAAVFQQRHARFRVAGVDQNVLFDAHGVYFFNYCLC